jgi:hypothetical protein
VGGGGGAKKKTSVGGGGGRGFAVHKCGSDGQENDAVPGHGDGVDLAVVEAVGEAAAWTRQC